MAARNEADLWRDLVDEAGEDAVLRAGQVTVEQAERELAAEGFDLASERARVDEPLRALHANRVQVPRNVERPSEERAWVARIPERVARERTPSTRWVWLVAAMLAIASAGGLLYGLAHRSKPVDLPREAPTLEAPAPPEPAVPRDVPSVMPTMETPAMGRKPFVSPTPHAP